MRIKREIRFGATPPRHTFINGCLHALLAASVPRAHPREPATARSRLRCPPFSRAGVPSGSRDTQRIGPAGNSRVYDLGLTHRAPDGSQVRQYLPDRLVTRMSRRQSVELHEIAGGFGKRQLGRRQGELRKIGQVLHQIVVPPTLEEDTSRFIGEIGILLTRRYRRFTTTKRSGSQSMDMTRLLVRSPPTAHIRVTERRGRAWL